MGRGRHCSAEERRLIRRLRDERKTYKSFAMLMKRSQNFVTNALKPEKIGESRGAPRKSSSKTDDRIVQLVKRDPFKSSRTIANEIGNIVSSRTVRRRMAIANLPGRIARRVPLLRSANLQMRKKFSLDRRTWCGPEGEKKLRNILWIDETEINFFGNDAKRNVRRPKGKEFDPKYTYKTVKHGGGSLMVWGCFSWDGVGPPKKKSSSVNLISVGENDTTPRIKFLGSI